MSDREKILDAVAPLKRGKWVSAALQPWMGEVAAAKFEELRSAVEERGNSAVDGAAVAGYAAGMEQAEKRLLESYERNRLLERALCAAREHDPSCPVSPATPEQVERMERHNEEEAIFNGDASPATATSLGDELRKHERYLNREIGYDERHADDSLDSHKATAVPPYCEHGYTGVHSQCPHCVPTTATKPLCDDETKHCRTCIDDDCSGQHTARPDNYHDPSNAV